MSININIKLAANTQGWMTYNELEWLATQAQKHSRIVEIGSYMGRSTRALGDNTEGVVYAIDNFKGPIEKDLPWFLQANLYDMFLFNVGDLLGTKVIPVIAEHKDVQLNFNPDMVFIDGSHQYEDVKYDIQKWSEVLAPGGLLCGHDIQFPQVKRAVEELLPSYKVGEDTTLWYVDF